LSNRDSWRVLGSGWEGSTFIYDDVVIKTFNAGQSPFRNCAPFEHSSHSKWPTEIPASLYFGGTTAAPNWNNNDSSHNDTVAYAGFLPVKAFFLAPAPEDSTNTPQWHLVTPLLRQGNIKALARRNRDDNPVKMPAEIDTLYRPKFNRLLQSLQSMHEAGFCHDDMKPSNIFVEDDGNWILGDLGNVRHISHSYHSSRIWQDNEQLLDCRANDAIRALKSYMSFLRTASMDKHGFDLDFVHGSTSYGQLFRDAIASMPVMTAEMLLRRSSVNNLGLTVRGSARPHTQQMSFFERQWLDKRVQRALRTSISERFARMVGVTWLFGVPQGLC